MNKFLLLEFHDCRIESAAILENCLTLNCSGASCFCASSDGVHADVWTSSLQLDFTLHADIPNMPDIAKKIVDDIEFNVTANEQEDRYGRRLVDGLKITGATISLQGGESFHINSSLARVRDLKRLSVLETVIWSKFA